MNFFIWSLLTVSANAHGLILATEGDNGVVAPGACVSDGTPRNCFSNACGAQADTAIIRDSEIESGQVGPLGRTEGYGRCEPETVIGIYMGLNGEKSSELLPPPDDELPRFGWGLGGSSTGHEVETIVAECAGRGRRAGLPTTDDKGRISLTYRQVNQDGGGPLTATIDPTSAATDPKAFKKAKVVTNIPGGGVAGVSTTVNTDFVIKVQVPDGMVCEGRVAGLDNVCFVRVRNQASAGPFGGAGFFTQSKAARKRAMEQRRKKGAENEEAN